MTIKKRIFCGKCRKELVIIDDYINASGEESFVVNGRCSSCIIDSEDKEYQEGYNEGYRARSEDENT